MTDQTNTIPATLAALRQRLGLSETQAAAYLGVPINTWRNWAKGLREPPAVMLRLLDVLGTVEVLAPAVHAALMPREKVKS